VRTSNRRCFLKCNESGVGERGVVIDCAVRRGAL